MSKRKPPGASPVKEKQSQHGKPILSPHSVSQQQQTHGEERMPSLCKCKAAPSSLEPSQLQPPYSDLLAQENPEKMMSLLQSFLLGNILKSCVKLYCRQLQFWKLVSIQKRLKSVFPRTKISVWNSRSWFQDSLFHEGGLNILPEKEYGQGETIENTYLQINSL